MNAHYLLITCAVVVSSLGALGAFTGGAMFESREERMGLSFAGAGLVLIALGALALAAA